MLAELVQDVAQNSIRPSRRVHRFPAGAGCRITAGHRRSLSIEPVLTNLLDNAIRHTPEGVISPWRLRRGRAR